MWPSYAAFWGRLLIHTDIILINAIEMVIFPVVCNDNKYKSQFASIYQTPKTDALHVGGAVDCVGQYLLTNTD
jgi:hypothetical protein